MKIYLLYLKIIHLNAQYQYWDPNHIVNVHVNEAKNFPLTRKIQMLKISLYKDLCGENQFSFVLLKQFEDKVENLITFQRQDCFRSPLLYFFKLFFLLIVCVFVFLEENLCSFNFSG